MPGDIVSRNGTLYVASSASASAWNVNSAPEWTPTYWTVYKCSASASAPAPAPAPSSAPSQAPACVTSAPAWNTTTRYMPGDIVNRNGTLYVASSTSASVWNVNSPPEWTPTYWAVYKCS